MSALDTTLRRNFIVAFVTHAVLITALFTLEKWAPDFSTPVVTPVDIVVPADILGDLPQGPSHGKGAYTPPPPAPPDTPGGNDTPAGTPTPMDETVSPPTPPTPPPAHNEIGIPSNKPPKQPVKPPKNPTPTKLGKPTPTNTGTAKGPTANQIRQRFLNALRNTGGTGTEGGTPYGDNRLAGGGTGKGRIGSPDGSPDGVPEGIGPGSPNWQYFLHVHDKMYEAWDNSIAMNDRNLLSVVTIRVARDGNIVSVTLKRSSGNKVMDNSALAAARKVQMLEPPPEALVKGSAAEISVDFQMEG
jgi:TonB family protein